MDLVYLAVLVVLVGATVGLAIACERLRPHPEKRP
jgi:hypothetical protein